MWREVLQEMVLPFGWVTIFVSVICGSIIGLERQLRGKPAGMRTSILICLGTALFVRLGAVLPLDHMDPARVLGQVITGIGFLGAGVILAQGGHVTGVTTASVVWILAAIGGTIGFGFPLAAISLSLITVLVLGGMEYLEERVIRLRRDLPQGDEGVRGDG